MDAILNSFNNYKYINRLLEVTRFNNQLLIPIKVLQHKQGRRYLLRIGSKEIETTSHVVLEEGWKYWGELIPSKEQIALRGLKKQPLWMQFEQFAFCFEVQHMTKIITLPNAADFLREQIALAMRDPASKVEFEFLVNLLTSMAQGVLTVPFVRYGNCALLQISGHQVYLATPHLGALSATINTKGKAIEVHTFFEGGHAFLQEAFLKALKGQFEIVEVNVVEHIDPLFEFRAYHEVLA